MPLRPELPPGLGLPRRGDPPLRPRMNFPMVGGATESSGAPAGEGPEMSTTKPEEGSAMEMMRTNGSSAPSTGPVLAARDCTRVIVYGKAGNPACLEVIQDLIDRQVCFTYHDVSRDEQAMMQLQAICGDSPMLPVVIQIGLRGA
ncbi:MAG: hypothetical protein ACOY94_04230 [Bacillota bacterium]